MAYNKKYLLFFYFWLIPALYFGVQTLRNPREFATISDKLWIEKEFEVLMKRTGNCGTWGKPFVVAKTGIAISVKLSNCKEGVSIIRKELFSNSWNYQNADVDQLPRYLCKKKYIAEIESFNPYETRLTIALKYSQKDVTCK